MSSGVSVSISNGGSVSPLGMSANKLAIHLSIPAPRINDVVREKRGISTDTALRLARFFDTTPEFWVNLQTAYDLKNAKAEHGSEIEQGIRPLVA